MTTAELNIGGDTKIAQKEIDKLTKDTAKLREQIRTMNEQAKKGARESQQAFSDFGATVAKVVTVGALVGRTYSDWQARAEGLRTEHEKLSTTIGQTLAKIGQLQNAPAIDEWMKGLAAKGITRESGQAAFEGVSRGGGLSLDRSLSVAEQVAQMGAALGPEGTQQFGDLANAIAKVSPGLKPDDVGDTAVALRRILGPEKASKFGSDAFQKQANILREGGMAEIDVLANAAVALDRDEKGNALDLLSAKKLSREDMARRKQVFAPESVAAMREQITRDQITNALTAEGGLTPSAAVSRNRAQVARDENLNQFGAGLGTLENVRTTILERSEQRGGVRGAMDVALDWANRGIDDAARFARIESPASQATSLANAAEKRGLISGAEKDELLAELREQTKLMRAERARPKPINVDAHNE